MFFFYECMKVCASIFRTIYRKNMMKIINNVLFLLLLPLKRSKVHINFKISHELMEYETFN